MQVKIPTLEEIQVINQDRLKRACENGWVFQLYIPLLRVGEPMPDIMGTINESYNI